MDWNNILRSIPIFIHLHFHEIFLHIIGMWMFRRFLMKMHVSIQIRMLLHKGIHYLHKYVPSMYLIMNWEIRRWIQKKLFRILIFMLSFIQFDNSFSECQERREFECGTPIVKRSSQFETIFYERACQPSGKFAWRGRFACIVYS